MTWDRASFLHEGLFFDSDEALAARCVPFVDEALSIGDPLVVVASDATRRVLRAELGSSVEDRFWLLSSPETWYRGNPVTTLQAYTSAMRPLQEAGRPWRLIGEPLWVTIDERALWHRLESACNITFANLPYHSLCLFDLRRLDDGHVNLACQTHRYRSADHRPVPNPAYVPPQEFLEVTEPSWDPRPARHIAGRASSASDARSLVSSSPRLADASPVLADALVVISELVTNSIEHGGAPATVRIWDSGEHTVVEVEDAGIGFDATLAGYRPPDPGSERGRGLWIARCLADDVVIRSGPGGTVARVFFRVGAADPARSGSRSAKR